MGRDKSRIWPFFANNLHDVIADSIISWGILWFLGGCWAGTWRCGYETDYYYERGAEILYIWLQTPIRWSISVSPTQLEARYLEASSAKCTLLTSPNASAVRPRQPCTILSGIWQIFNRQKETLTTGVCSCTPLSWRIYCCTRSMTFNSYHHSSNGVFIETSSQPSFP